MQSSMLNRDTLVETRVFTAERPLSRRAARDTDSPVHWRMSTAKPAANLGHIRNILPPADRVDDARVLLAYWPSRAPMYLPHAVKSLIRSLNGQ